MLNRARSLAITCFGILGASLFLALPTASAAQSPSAFADTAPAFDPMKFFTGHTRSWGVLENRGGEATQRILTETWGRMVGGELRMEQDLFIGTEPRSPSTIRTMAGASPRGGIRSVTRTAPASVSTVDSRISVSGRYLRATRRTSPAGASNQRP